MARMDIVAVDETQGNIASNSLVTVDTSGGHIYHMPGDVVRLMLIRKGRFMYLDYELTSLDFDSYIEYYDKRREDTDEKSGPVPEPKKEEEEEPATPEPTPKPPHMENSD